MKSTFFCFSHFALCISTSFGQLGVDTFAREDQVVPGEVIAETSSFDGRTQSWIDPLATELPYAYYPSYNQIVVVFDLHAARERIEGSPDLSNVNSIGVRIVSFDSNEEVARGSIALRTDGKGQGKFEIPELAEGEYRVIYEVGSYEIDAGPTIVRKHFPWEGSTLGEEHKVCLASGRLLSAAGSGNPLNQVSLPAVSMKPGAIPTLRISGPHSMARDCTRPSRPALATLYGKQPGMVFQP